MILQTKLVFHIPLYAWMNGEPEAVNFKEPFSSKLSDKGFDNWYSTPIRGHYKGRDFDEEILTLFCSYEDKQKAISAFQETIQENRYEMKQEAYAYECGDALYIVQ